MDEAMVSNVVLKPGLKAYNPKSLGRCVMRFASCLDRTTYSNSPAVLDLVLLHKMY